MGVLSMAWVPRIPEIKRSLGINNGQFGLLLLTSSTASILGTQFVGRLVHHFGSKTVLRVVTLGLPIGVILISRTTHTIFGMAFALFFTAFNLVSMDLSINVQAVAIENHLGRRYMSSFHGMWSVGALTATIFGGSIARIAAPETNLLIIGIAGALANTYALSFSLSNAEDGHEGDSEATGKIPLFAKKYLILWLLGFGMIGALLPEGAVSDWSAILLKENMGIGKGLNATGYGFFALAMVISRLTGDKILTVLGPERTMKLGGYIGGSGLAIGIAIGVPLSHHHPMPALIIIDIGFLFAGLGVGPMIPAMMVAAAALPGIAPSVAMSRILIIGMAAYFVGPSLTGGLAQWFNLPVAMFFPAATLICAGWLSRSLKD